MKVNHIHTGYRLTITEETMNKLEIKECLKNPIVAVLFKEEQEKMIRWYKSAQTKQTPCFVQGFFRTEKYLVLHCTIGGTHQWVTLIKDTNISPIELKKKISRGELGKETVIEKFLIPCVPYIF